MDLGLPNLIPLKLFAHFPQTLLDVATRFQSETTALQQGAGILYEREDTDTTIYEFQFAVIFLVAPGLGTANLLLLLLPVSELSPSATMLVLLSTKSIPVSPKPLNVFQFFLLDKFLNFL
jgi:hypothetical protein